MFKGDIEYVEEDRNGTGKYLSDGERERERKQEQSKEFSNGRTFEIA